MRLTTKLVLGAAAAICLLCVVGCDAPSGTSPDSSAAPTATPTPAALETMLATIDGVQDDQVKVARYKYLLGALSDTFVEKPKEISDLTVASQTVMREKGVEEADLDILEDMNRVFDSRIANQKYREYVAAYITLRVKGQSREESSHGLHELIGAIAHTQ